MSEVPTATDYTSGPTDAEREPVLRSTPFAEHSIVMLRQAAEESRSVAQTIDALRFTMPDILFDQLWHKARRISYLLAGRLAEAETEAAARRKA